MGREIHRVPLDFDWPLNVQWKGYVLPDSLEGTPCLDCQGGQTYTGWWMQSISYLFGMLLDDLGDQESGRRAHPWISSDFPNPPGVWEDGIFVPHRPGPDIFDLMAAITADDDNVNKSDSRFALYRMLKRFAGKDFFTCKVCNGEGAIEEYAGQFKERDEWERSDPPNGPGYQLWETVSEGSPISPVFGDPRALAQWMIHNGHSSHIEKALEFIQQGWAPSGVIVDGEIVLGVNYIGSRDND